MKFNFHNIILWKKTENGLVGWPKKFAKIWKIETLQYYRIQKIKYYRFRFFLKI